MDDEEMFATSTSEDAAEQTKSTKIDGGGGRGGAPRAGGGAHFTESVYMWAYGDQAEDREESIKSSDIIIGWLILLFQAIAYLLVILKTSGKHEASHSPTEEAPEDEPLYSLASVTVAFYLLIATASPDLRGGFSLLVDGTSTRCRLFGAALLCVFGLMVTAAMKVLFSSADNDTEVVANAVTVLFIADVDEKALTFFLTVPQKWRLFWVLNMISMSFALALVGLVYVGDAWALNISPDSRFSFLDTLPSWFVFVVNPGCCTYFSFVISRSLQALLDARDYGGTLGSKLPWLGVVRLTVGGAWKSLSREPGLYMVLAVWLISGIAGWYMGGIASPPLLVEVTSSADVDHTQLTQTSSCVGLVSSTVALLLGIAMFGPQRALAQFPRANAFPQRHQWNGRGKDCGISQHDVASVGEEDINSPRSGTPCGLCALCASGLDGSRIPSVLVGWGLGYCASSLLYISVVSWPEGWWGDSPLYVKIVAFLVVPVTSCCGIFMIADADFLGDRATPYLRPVVDVLKKPDGIIHWIMVTIARDCSIVWVFYLIGFLGFSPINLL